MPRFTFWAHLRSRAAALGVLVPLELLLYLVLSVTTTSADLTILVCVLVAGAAVLALVLDFLRVRRFWEGLSDLAESLDNPRLLPSLIKEPGFSEGDVAYAALDSVARSANEEVAEYRRHVDDYRAYVETWVHEAKSPLAAARLTLENLEVEAAADSTRLRALGDELSRVEGYVEQALFYARSETVECDYLVRGHVLQDVVNSAVRANASLLIGAHVMPQFGEGLGLEVFTDDKWLGFMLGQVLQNSARYARLDAEGGSRVTFRARLVDEGLAEERVELTVADNGCGVSAADLPRVFERGFTGENGRNHKRSTGLGLWLVARLAAKMGISVRADSREGEGFSVALSFPANKMHYFD